MKDYSRTSPDGMIRAVARDAIAGGYRVTLQRRERRTGQYHNRDWFSVESEGQAKAKVRSLTKDVTIN